jgi:hypothetical protein
MRNIINATGQLLSSSSLTVGSPKSSHYQVGPTCQVRLLPPPLLLPPSLPSPSPKRRGPARLSPIPPNRSAAHAVSPRRALAASSPGNPCAAGIDPSPRSPTTRAPPWPMALAPTRRRSPARSPRRPAPCSPSCARAVGGASWRGASRPRSIWRPATAASRRRSARRRTVAAPPVTLRLDPRRATTHAPSPSHSSSRSTLSHHRRTPIRAHAVPPSPLSSSSDPQQPPQQHDGLKHGRAQQPSAWR